MLAAVVEAAEALDEGGEGLRRGVLVRDVAAQGEGGGADAAQGLLRGGVLVRVGVPDADLGSSFADGLGKGFREVRGGDAAVGPLGS